MRKIFIGIFIGFTLSFAAGAHAEVINIIKNVIGQTVQGQFPVTVNGVKLDEPAAVIKVGTEDKGYLPIRAIGDSLGVEITFDSNLGIFINGKPKTVGDAVYQPTTRRQTIFPENPPLSKSDEIESKIQTNKGRQATYNNFLRMAEDNLTRKLAPDTMDEMRGYVTEYRSELDKLNAELADLERQKSELNK